MCVSLETIEQTGRRLGKVMRAVALAWLPGPFAFVEYLRREFQRGAQRYDRFHTVPRSCPRAMKYLKLP